MAETKVMSRRWRWRGRRSRRGRHGFPRAADGELQGAVHAVLAAMTKAIDGAPTAALQVGKVEVAFNVAFARMKAFYICSSAEAAFSVKVSLEPVTAD